MTAVSALEVARKFFDAIEAGDAATVASIYRDDAVIWHNFDQTEQSKTDNLAVLRRMISRTSQRRYAERALRAIEGGFVQQHVLRSTRVDGRRLELPACIVCQVADGQITRLDEYFDTAPLAGWHDPLPGLE